MRFVKDVRGGYPGSLSVVIRVDRPVLAFDVLVVQAESPGPRAGGEAVAGQQVLRAVFPSPRATSIVHPFQYVPGGASSLLRDSFEEALLGLPRFADGTSVQPFLRAVIDAHDLLLHESAPAMMAFCAAVLLDFADGGRRSTLLLEEARRHLDVMEVQTS